MVVVGGGWRTFVHRLYVLTIEALFFASKDDKIGGKGSISASPNPSMRGDINVQFVCWGACCSVAALLSLGEKPAKLRLGWSTT